MSSTEVPGGPDVAEPPPSGPAGGVPPVQVPADTPVPVPEVSPYGCWETRPEPLPRPSAPRRPTSRRRTGPSITGLVLGLVTVRLCWLVPVALPIGLIGLAFGTVALVGTSRGTRDGHGLAVAGTVAPVVGLVGTMQAALPSSGLVGGALRVLTGW